MGEAKRRAVEIAELKKTPVERKRRKLILLPLRSEKTNHFTNAAARTSSPVDDPNATGMPPNLVNPVTVKVKGHAWNEAPPRPPRQLQPITFVTGRKLTDEEFLIHASAMMQINPKGFRQISAKEKNYRSTSMLEQLSIKLGDTKPRIGPERSKRGLKKREACQQTKALILIDRFLENEPGRADRYYFAKVMGALNGDIDPTWLENTVKQKVKIGGIDPKYLSAHARRRREAKALGLSDLLVDGQVHAFKEAA